MYTHPGGKILTNFSRSKILYKEEYNFSITEIHGLCDTETELA